MDQSWITTSKPGDPKYEVGVMEFIRFALDNNSEGRERLPCPCYMCHNLMHHKVDIILRHLNKWEFDRTYTCWHRHGEKKEITSTSGHHGHNVVEGDRLEDMMDKFEEETYDDPNVAGDMLGDFERPLYEGSVKYNKLSAVLKLYNLKVVHGWTDQSFSALLELLIDILPPDNLLPNNTYEAKKVLCTLGLRYEKIHACPNDCILYQNEFESLKSCPECNFSRYKKKKGIPAKVLWYFPIIPRFRRMYLDPTDAKNLTWHKFGRKKDDGLLRHPADSPQWRFIDGEFSDFGKEERNLRLGLSTDGMNPFRSLSSMHSTWPVMLVTYNLPPSLCMKRKYVMLSMLISGPKQPGNDIDVYLEPLIEVLKFLWEKGVEAFDASRNETFNLRAMLFCTIQDYPAYGNHVVLPCPEDELRFVCQGKDNFLIWPCHLVFPLKKNADKECAKELTSPSALSPLSQSSTSRKYTITAADKSKYRKDITKMKKNPFIKWKNIEINVSPISAFPWLRKCRSLCDKDPSQLSQSFDQ